MWVVDDATLAFLEVNEAAVRHYGYTRAEFLRMTLQDIRPPADVPSVLADDPWPLTARHQGQVEQARLLRHRTRDGTRIDVEIHSSTIVFHGRQAHLAMAYDVTERVRAEGEAEQRRREAEVLARLAQTMSASLDLDTVLQRIAEGAWELCGSERALIMLRESGGEALVSRYQAGFPQMPYAGVRIEPGKGMGGWVLATGRPLRTADYAADSRFSKDYLHRIRTEGRLAILTVPITIGSRVEGLLYVSNPVTHPFTARDETILLRLADYAASAIRNAQLYHAAQAELTRRTQVEAQLQASLQEKEVLLQEIHHRVKNNLQMVSSLLNLQARAVDDPHLRALLHDSRQRLQAMALIHEALYQAHDLALVPFGTYVRQLTAQLFRAYGGEARRIRLIVHADPLDLEIDKATPCGLILHELLANAFTHAFPDGRPGTIDVALRRAARQPTPFSILAASL
jgi:PAS domain S-box-containing protein